jgi:hypothetical protein
MIMVRCSVPGNAPQPMLWVDHFTMTEGGITGEEIVAVTRRFVKVIRDSFMQHDSDDIIA